ASSFSKPKVLTATSTLKFIPEELVVFCRDFRLLRFCFPENGLAPQAFRVANAIARAREAAAWLGDTGEGPEGWVWPHEIPSEEEDGEEEEEEEEEEGSAATLLFESLQDWEQELQRLGAQGWRVSAANERFDLAPSLPRYLWVPSGLLDHDLKRIFVHFEERRVPRLCWHHPTGGDLLRASNFHAASEPSSEDVRAGTGQQGRDRAAGQGQGWQGRDRAAGQGTPPQHLLSVPLPTAEPSDRDLNCLLSSLVQLLGDPHARSLPGFQSLVQREWVAAGHPFPHRLGLLRGDNPREEAPVFLLFLDCSWQLLRQFPAAFGFTEGYLLALHDSCFAPYCSTFLFSCQRQRRLGTLHRAHSQTYTPMKGWWHPQGPPGAAVGVRPGARLGSAACRLPTVWAWRLRYSRQQLAHFRNPAGAAGTVGPPRAAHPQAMGRLSAPCLEPAAGSLLLLSKGTLCPQPFPWRSSRPPPRLSRWTPSLES
ncbi:MTMRB protein, partial [Psilopogon haemacephalus]|nr:MTMRB protein [Psilopogon haemacephalus]